MAKNARSQKNFAAMQNQSRGIFDMDGIEDEVNQDLAAAAPLGGGNESQA